LDERNARLPIIGGLFDQEAGVVELGRFRTEEDASQSSVDGLSSPEEIVFETGVAVAAALSVSLVLDAILHWMLLPLIRGV
jgi:hypothetical protein